MIKAVLIDDERPALRELEFLLKKYSEISIAGVYTNPLKAIEDIRQLKPEVVFLDINMPQLLGIDAASRILEGSPDTDVIFVTAYDQYAIEAFELHALDYVLKPINAARLQKTIDRILKKQPVEQQNHSHKLKIKCLGRFQVGWDNQEPVKWRAEKTKELFAFLFHNQGRSISKDELLDRLWPEDDPDKAIRQLYNGIYYIRKALEGYGVDREIMSIGSSYNLKLGAVDYDVGSLYELEKSNPADTIEKFEKMEDIYTGEYLEGEYYAWADAERERLANLHQHALIKLAKLYIEKGQFDEAEKKLKKAYNINPYEEIISELLMKLYIETGDKSKAVRHFNAYSKLLIEELGIKTDKKLYELYEAVK